MVIFNHHLSAKFVSVITPSYLNPISNKLKVLAKIYRIACNIWNVHPVAVLEMLLTCISKLLNEQHMAGYTVCCIHLCQYTVACKLAKVINHFILFF